MIHIEIYVGKENDEIKDYALHAKKRVFGSHYKACTIINEITDRGCYVPGYAYTSVEVTGPRVSSVINFNFEGMEKRDLPEPYPECWKGIMK